MQAAPWVWWGGKGWWGSWAFFLGKDGAGVECGAAQASKGPVGESRQGSEACGAPKGICERKGGLVRAQGKLTLRRPKEMVGTR